jgi:hypothetical protein
MFDPTSPNSGPTATDERAAAENAGAAMMSWLDVLAARRALAVLPLPEPDAPVEAPAAAVDTAAAPAPPAPSTEPVFTAGQVASIVDQAVAKAMDALTGRYSQGGSAPAETGATTETPSEGPGAAETGAESAPQARG